MKTQYKTKAMTRARSVVTALTTGKVLDMSRHVGVVGCTGAELVWHLERQFAEGMDWRNRGQWEVDHIWPVCLFGDGDDDVRECNHWSNLRPAWPERNVKRVVAAGREGLTGPDYRVFRGLAPRETRFVGGVLVAGVEE